MKPLIDRFLRLFYAYADMERRMREAGEARLDAEDELRRMRARVTDLERDIAAARKESTEAHEKITDWMALRCFGAPIFDRNATFPMLEQSSIDNLQRTTRMTGRDFVNQKTREFYEECLRNAQSE